MASSLRSDDEKVDERRRCFFGMCDYQGPRLGGVYRRSEYVIVCNSGQTRKACRDRGEEVHRRFRIHRRKQRPNQSWTVTEVEPIDVNVAVVVAASSISLGIRA